MERTKGPLNIIKALSDSTRNVANFKLEPDQPMISFVSGFGVVSFVTQSLAPIPDAPI